MPYYRVNASKRGTLRRDYHKRNLNNPFYNRRSSKQERVIMRFKIFAGLALALLILIIWSLLSARTLSLDSITINGLKRVDKNEVRALIDQQVNSHRALIFSQKNILIFSKKELSATLNAKYNFANVKISKKFFHGLNVDIGEREFAFVYGEKGHYYYIDNTGYILEEIPVNFTPLESLLNLSTSTPTSTVFANATTTASTSTPVEVYNPAALKAVEKLNNNLYPLIDNLSDAKINNNRVSLENNYLILTQKIFANLMAGNDPVLVPERFIIDTDYLSIKLILSSGLTVYFSPTDDLDRQLRNLWVLRRELKDNFNKSIKKEINLKYGDRVYYE